jgi:hypothetical protein
MRRLIVILTTTTFGLGMTLVPSPASAAAGEFGNSCQATTGPGNTSGVMMAKGGANPLPITAPSTGVITKATLNLPGVAAVPETLRVLRGTGVPNEFTVLAESAPFTLTAGTVGYPVRVPVTAGDLLGLGGSAALMCATGDAADVVGVITGNPAVGAPATYTPTTSRALSVVATIEPDVDKDGYGDTTQDLCPQSASFQSACPVVILDSFAAPSGNKIAMVVTTDANVNVNVTGKAKVNGKTLNLKGGTKACPAGTLTKFTVKLPKALKSALADLPPSKRIKVTLTATTTDLVGRVATDQSTVKLPGTR